MKKIKKFIFKTFLILSLILCGLIFASCDLSHKHFFDAYGKCKNCNFNSCITITKNQSSNSYTSNYANINTKDDGYFKFTSNGENGIIITFTKNQSTSIGQTNFKQIKFYSEKSSLIASNINSNILEYNGKLELGVTYYIYLNIENYSADIMLNIAEINN